MSQPILVCDKLSKSYKKGVTVLDALDFTVEPGKIVGLLGPNGCGKSTLLKLISGLLTPDSGSITVCGQERNENSNALISFLPERPYFSAGMTVNAMMDYFGDFYQDFDRSLAEVMLADLAIDPKARMRTLSKGTKEKVQLILVMARRAKLYLLDEPIGGVDPAARDYILKTIIGNYNPEASVIITTHLIADVESVLDDFAFVDKGKIAMYGNADEVREEHSKTLDELFREVFKCSRNA
ncbi:MAG: ABC transporter ATP-binding protein [Clostridia bacterium]|nr:ABC transporter ATP-binding protein [Clostridia bacterium]